ncbi:MAG: hypothetical protein NTU54_03135 [Candidatus Omnitrophica bacterium]|nr:hypothetical protein [Candidatus Omnitrophota bacterium]
MKKILLLALLILPLMIGGIVFAENASSCAGVNTSALPSPKAAVTHETPKVNIVTGKVEEVNLADPAKGTKSEVTVVSEDGAKVTVLVKTNTTIYGADWKAIGLEKIKPGDTVKIKYLISKEGVREARSLSLVK